MALIQPVLSPASLLALKHPGSMRARPSNALGKEEGGSGVSLEREKYMASVDFWSKNAPLK